MKTAKLFYESNCQLAEGIFWHPIQHKLYWIDIEGKMIHRCDEDASNHQTCPVPEKIGTMAPLKNGNLLVALASGIAEVNFEKQTCVYKVKIEADNAQTRFNDGKCDTNGRLWAGTMDVDAKKSIGSLYRIDSDFNVTTHIKNVGVSNGLAWSLDNKFFYYIDSPKGTITRFNFNSLSGEIINPEILLKIPESDGTPDGMTIDNEGNLWVALWDGHNVIKVHPETGNILDQIKLPVPRVSCCTFGGKNLKTLFITTAKEGLSDNQLQNFPLSGGIFKIDLDTKGIEVNFAGM